MITKDEPSAEDWKRAVEDAEMICRWSMNMAPRRNQKLVFKEMLDLVRGIINAAGGGPNYPTE